MALALDADIGVYYVDVSLGDGVNRTLRQADPACDTVFSYLKRQ